MNIILRRSYLTQIAHIRKTTRLLKTHNSIFFFGRYEIYHDLNISQADHLVVHEITNLHDLPTIEIADPRLHVLVVANSLGSKDSILSLIGHHLYIETGSVAALMVIGHRLSHASYGKVHLIQPDTTELVVLSEGVAWGRYGGDETRTALAGSGISSTHFEARVLVEFNKAFQKAVSILPTSHETIQRVMDEHKELIAKYDERRIISED